MNSFIKAFSEFFNAKFIENTKPRLIWLNDRYEVTWFYSEQTIIKMGGEIII